MKTIELHQVCKTFNQYQPNEFHAIRDIDLRIEPRQATVLKGPSGSGKTTLLAMIGCLSRPTSGRITLGGETLSGLPERFMTEVRRRTFGFIFQQFNLIRGLTVSENVMLPAYPLGLPRERLGRKTAELLARFDLAPKAQLKVEFLSGGEAQRTAICRALINDPEILIADEPTANLDTRLSAEFMQLAHGLVAEGRTILMTSHDPEVFDSPMIDRVVAIRDGRLEP
ncbi:MAG: ABC transporter ATP-binding protein [Gammaproteobacteria bacterium]|nr:ABC transporter ATP-binding protein [Gammaproteobacteria bacterium]